MGDEAKSPNSPSEREAKLAQALRANLRRRKAAARESAPPPAETPKS